MSSVISSTTGAVYGATPAMSRHDEFVGAAGLLLEDARGQLAAGAADLALESAYRAALRTAGAMIAQSATVSRRKRLPSSAWDKLALTGPRGKYWAEIFVRFSRQRGRVASGIELHPDPVEVERLFEYATAFYEETAGEKGGASAA